MLTANPQAKKRARKIDLEIERRWLDKLVPGYTGDNELHHIGGEAMTIRREWWEPSYNFLENYYQQGHTDIDLVTKLPSFQLQKHKQRIGVSSSPGIYFAFQGSELVYIGSASSITSRVTSTHHKLKVALRQSKVLKIHYFVVTHRNYENLLSIEKELIEHFQPKLNTQYAGHNQKKKRPTKMESDPNSQKLSIYLDEPFMDALANQASIRGVSPERLAQKLLRQAINMIED